MVQSAKTQFRQKLNVRKKQHYDTHQTYFFKKQYCLYCLKPPRKQMANPWYCKEHDDEHYYKLQELGKSHIQILNNLLFISLILYFRESLPTTRG